MEKNPRRMRQMPIFLVIIIKLLKMLGLCVTLGQNPSKSTGENVDLISGPGGRFSESSQITTLPQFCHSGFPLFRDSVPVVKKNSISCLQLCYTQDSLNTLSRLTLLVTKCVCWGDFPTPNNSGTPELAGVFQFNPVSMLSPWRWLHIPVKGSVPQDHPHPWLHTLKMPIGSPGGHLCFWPAGCE